VGTEIFFAERGDEANCEKRLKTMGNSTERYMKSLNFISSIY